MQRSLAFVLKHGNQRGGKRKLIAITEQFVMKENESEGAKKLTATCDHCKKVVQGPCLKINVSRLRSHLLKCSQIPEATRRLSMSASQRARKIIKLGNIIGASQSKNHGGKIFPKAENLSTIGSRPLNSIRGDRNKLIQLKGPNRADGKKFVKLDSFVKVWTKDKAERAIRAIVETILSRFEPPARIEDTFFLAQLKITTPGLVK